MFSVLPLPTFFITFLKVSRDQCPTRGTSAKHHSLNMMNPNPGDRQSSEPIASEKVSIDRKLFFLDLKENQRGRFLKITEDVGGRRDTIMLPAGAFRDFLEALQRLVEFESKL